MEKLLAGVVQFKKKDFEKHRDLFNDLEEKQTPHTLFIGCSDSRVVPSLITQTLPGELFIVRNVANMVPPYRIADEYLSTTAAIEYAVMALRIENIIICGHSNCGGCALLHDGAPGSPDLPNTKKWMELAGPVAKSVASALEGKDSDPAAKAWLTEQTNVVQQMKHLLSYPYIATEYEAGRLDIIGWHYIIPSGQVYEYSKKNGEFIALN